MISPPNKSIFKCSFLHINLDCQFKFIEREEKMKSLLLHKTLCEITGIQFCSANCYWLVKPPGGYLGLKHRQSSTAGSQGPQAVSLPKYGPKSLLIYRWLDSTFQMHHHQPNQIMGHINSASEGAFWVTRICYP